MEETTTAVPPDGFGDSDITGYESRGVVPIEVVLFGGGGGDGGAVPSEAAFLGGDGGLGAVSMEAVCSDGAGRGVGVVVSWHPPLQLVTTMVEVVRVV